MNNSPAPVLANELPRFSQIAHPGAGFLPPSEQGWACSGQNLQNLLLIFLIFKGGCGVMLLVFGVVWKRKAFLWHGKKSPSVLLPW